MKNAKKYSKTLDEMVNRIKDYLDKNPESDDDFKNTIKNGIRKVNICTEMCIAARESYLASANHEILFNDAKEAVKNVVKTKMQLFGSSGKA